MFCTPTEIAIEAAEYFSNYDVFSFIQYQFILKQRLKINKNIKFIPLLHSYKYAVDFSKIEAFPSKLIELTIDLTVTEFMSTFLVRFLIINLAFFMPIKLKKTLSSYYENHNSPKPNNQPFLNQLDLGVSENDSILVDEINNSIEPDFQTKNFVYELQSKCNNLEYQKTKTNIAYQTTIHDLKHKNNQLEQLVDNLTQQNQQLTQELKNSRNILQKVQTENNLIKQENNGLKHEIQNSLSSQITIRGIKNVADIQEELSEAKELLQMKNQEISRLKNRISKFTQNGSSFRQESIVMLKQRTKQLQKENAQLTHKLDQANKRLNSVTLNNQTKKGQQDVEQLTKQMRKKQSELQQLRKDKTQLLIQLEQSHSNQRRGSITTGNESVRRLKQTLQIKQIKLKEMQNDRTQYENRINELSIDLNRMTSQKTSIQQYNKHLEISNSQSESKIRIMQEELCQNEKQLAELKAQMLSLRLQNKKAIASLRLQFEQQRLKNTKSIELKEKQIIQLKQLEFSWRKSSGSVNPDAIPQELASRQQQIDDLNQQNQSLKKHSQALKLQLKNIQAKYDSKYIKLQKQLRSEYQKKRPHQSDAPKFSFQSVEMPPKSILDVSQYNYSRIMMTSLQRTSKDDKNQDLLQLLKIQKKQQMENIRELVEKQKEQSQTILRIQQQLKEIKVSKAQYASQNNREKQEKIRVINQLSQEIDKLNQQLRRQRNNNEQLRKQIKSKDQKHLKQADELQQELQTLQQDYDELSQKIAQFQTQLHEKDSILINKQQDIAKLNQQIQNNKTCENYFESKIIELQQMLDLLKSNKQIQKNNTKLLQNSNQFTQQQHLEPNSTSRQELPPFSQRDHIDQTKQLESRVQQLQIENYTLKSDYSESLQQINTILLRFRTLQHKYHQLKIAHNNLKYIPPIQSYKRLNQSKSAQDIMKNYEIQIKTNNQIFMNNDNPHHRSSHHLYNGYPNYFQDKKQHDIPTLHAQQRKIKKHGFPQYEYSKQPYNKDQFARENSDRLHSIFPYPYNQ